MADRVASVKRGAVRASAAARPGRCACANPFRDELPASHELFRQTYHVAYVQHAPMEPRAAVAEWNGGRLTVWTATHNPFGVRSELVRAFHLSPEDVQVIVPDFGGGFGGKHTGETAVEAARLARSAGRSVSLTWTREEEFTWSYFVRPPSSTSRRAWTATGCSARGIS